jgi:hypothetical protein
MCIFFARDRASNAMRLMTAEALFTGLRACIDNSGTLLGQRFLPSYLSRTYGRIHLRKTPRGERVRYEAAGIRTTHRGIIAKSDGPERLTSRSIARTAATFSSSKFV